MPRAGSLAFSDASATGGASSVTREAVVGYEPSPLRTGGLGRGGGAAVDSSLATAATASASSAVAKGVVADNNITSSDLGAAGSAEGSTVAAAADGVDASESCCCMCTCTHSLDLLYTVLPIH